MKEETKKITLRTSGGAQLPIERQISAVVQILCEAGEHVEWYVLDFNGGAAGDYDPPASPEWLTRSFRNGSGPITLSCEDAKLLFNRSVAVTDETVLCAVPKKSRPPSPSFADDGLYWIRLVGRWEIVVPAHLVSAVTSVLIDPYIIE